MRVHLFGVRGSTPAPGPEFVRFGGNTSCVAVAHEGHPASLVLDAGTGIQRLGDHLGGGAFDGTILLTHLHWDHVEGLPFCGATDREDARTDLFLPVQPRGRTASEALEQMMSPPAFPIGPDGLRGQWTFSTLEPGQHKFERFSVTATEVAHKGGTTFGYRISDGDSSMVYIPDHCPTQYGAGLHGWGEYPPHILDLARDADVLIHDGLLTTDELPHGAAFGHAAADYAVELGRAAGIGTVVLFHHSHRRTDTMLDAVGRRFRGSSAPEVVLAMEGMVLDL